jgi:hypothetical protein
LGLGIGDWGLANPPIPNPQVIIIYLNCYLNKFNFQIFEIKV